ncbi:DUF3805 domain-containing protein [Segetibacter koreensis]|uniref:DUF3805 domain-containing protein n=1 Tax=Segetibacter koreensis TaxID=398037 RepID=UPI00146DCE26|nr:DUF3805 domain-containing protein [Segetibacter koreensis]
MKTFTSEDGWYSLNLPPEWEEYDDEKESTHAFFNAKSWTGNFRITTLHWDTLNDTNEDKASQLVAEDVEENQGAILTKVNGFDCAHYKNETEDEDGVFVIYYWVFGKDLDLFICSFTIAKKQEGTHENDVELKIVRDIIDGIHINY